MDDELVAISKTQGVGTARLNRPHARNALNSKLMARFSEALEEFENDPSVGAIVVTGGDQIFSAGADIKEMTDKSFAEAYLEDFVTKGWEPIPTCRKPVIAAVAGYAVGGGCELALSCDIVIADDTARFGQPEVSVGTIPGGGGTQRLARLAGRHKAMELCLTGRIFDAAEAERIGLVSRVVRPGDLMQTAQSMAEKIATASRPVVYMIKESINRAFETTLAEGLRFERRMLHATFALDDQREAMAAFAERREPKFTHR